MPDPRSVHAAVRLELDRKNGINHLRAVFAEQFEQKLVQKGHRISVDEDDHGGGKSKSGAPSDHIKTSTPLLQPPREALNRFLFSGHEESLAMELVDDCPLKLHNWYPTEIEKQRQNYAHWRTGMRKWLHQVVPDQLGNDLDVPGLQKQPGADTFTSEPASEDRVVSRARGRPEFAHVSDATWELLLQDEEEEVESVKQAEATPSCGTATTPNRSTPDEPGACSSRSDTATSSRGDGDPEVALGNEDEDQSVSASSGSSEEMNQEQENLRHVSPDEDSRRNHTSENEKPKLPSQRLTVSPNQLRSASREIVGPIVLPIAREIAKEMRELRDQALFCVKESNLKNLPRSHGQEDDHDLLTVDVQPNPEKKIYVMRAGDEEITLSEWALQKLSKLYHEECDRTNGKGSKGVGVLASEVDTGSAAPPSALVDHRSIDFYTAAFCCALRYSALGGKEQVDGAGLQAAMPQKVFDVLPWQVRECFASPFNVSKAPPRQVRKEEASASSTALVVSTSAASSRDDGVAVLAESTSGSPAEPLTVLDSNSPTRSSTSDLETVAPAAKRRKVLDDPAVKILADSTANGLISKPKQHPTRTYNAYCSFFEEDKLFGSSGSFFDFITTVVPPVRGEGAGAAAPFVIEKEDNSGAPYFFEVNPPFDVDVIHRVLTAIERTLSSSQRNSVDANKDSSTSKQATFLLIVPEWLQQGTFRKNSPIDRILSSKFLRATVVKKPHKHKYVKGRCWHWKKMENGPPLSPGVSKSRATLLSNFMENEEAEELMAKIAREW
ncbi:unnamed protein product [Amoebophrya sp. A120]|nr:unnamed protein product [Amoebophrya sp. A120]|eukprot:GSA120T00017231001.1